MNSLLSAAPVGAQRPRLLSVPEYGSSAGQEAVDLCRMAGLDLDPWQELVLAHSLGERPDGLWAAMEVGLCVPRQNGKGSIEEGRELVGLFLLLERLLVHTAHLFKTSLEAFRRLLMLIENTPDLDSRVKRVSKAHGEEGIELKGGQRIQFATRTLSAGRGLSGDCVIFDEAMFIREATINSLLPVLSARPNPQLWYVGSAVDEEEHEHGVIFSRLRARAQRGDPKRLAWFEWSIDADHPDDVTEAMADDPELWAQANPGLGQRISEDFIREVERQSLSFRGFVVERLGAGAWPAVDGSAERKITDDAWAACMDVDSVCDDPVCFTFDVTPDRRASVISVAGWREDGLPHVEVADARSGTEWVAERQAELAASHRTMAILYDKRGPAAGLVSALKKALTERGVDFKECAADDEKVPEYTVRLVGVGASELAQACGVLFDAVEQVALRHIGTPELFKAIKGAATRPLGDAWAWARKSSSANIAPLVGCTLALWGLKSIPVDDGAGDPLIAFI
jgi:hypothetical protein